MAQGKTPLVVTIRANSSLVEPSAYNRQNEGSIPSWPTYFMTYYLIGERYSVYGTWDFVSYPYFNLRDAENEWIRYTSHFHYEAYYRKMWISALPPVAMQRHAP